MKKVCIITLGCKVNQYESDAIYYALKTNGFMVVTKLTEADYYIINSCAVTNEAEHKSREYISKILKLNNSALIYVCGCSAELHPEKFLNKPNVEFLIGTENKLKVVDAILNHEKGNHKLPIQKIYEDSYIVEPTKTRCAIKIQDGCNNFCSYCIIPYTRGRERSRTIESIEREVKRLSTKTKEIVLVGINIAGYGKDLTPTQTLSDVVNIFKNYPNLRLRLSSFEMGTINDDLLIALSNLPNFCPFFHISLQSGSDTVLKKMNRHHSFLDYYNTINKILTYFPNAGISTDIIAGFPTETDEDFETELQNLNKITFCNMHIFPYSKREGTVASKLPQINGTIIKNRAKILLELANKTRQDFIQSQIGKTEEVLIEEVKSGFLTGFTKNYLKTYIAPSDKLKLNHVYKIKIISPYLDGVMGELQGE